MKLLEDLPSREELATEYLESVMTKEVSIEEALKSLYDSPYLGVVLKRSLNKIQAMLREEVGVSKGNTPLIYILTVRGVSVEVVHALIDQLRGEFMEQGFRMSAEYKDYGTLSISLEWDASSQT